MRTFPHCNRVPQRPHSCWFKRLGCPRKVNGCYLRRDPEVAPPAFEPSFPLLERTIAWGGVAASLMAVAMVTAHVLTSLRMGLQP